MGKWKNGSPLKKVWTLEEEKLIILITNYDNRIFIRSKR